MGWLLPSSCSACLNALGWCFWAQASRETRGSEMAIPLELCWRRAIGLPVLAFQLMLASVRRLPRQAPPEAGQGS
jgi:hypothetical protein